ncbi:MAG: hypothetical protein HY665_05040 [Chloroflexi bacterium]|nr:hypothetical protein [Chloroflexota bacterium]
MTVLLTQQETRSKAAMPSRPTRVKELAALCPRCHAFETLPFIGDGLVQTRKFVQVGNQIYHDCGSNEPCRLYRVLD